MLWMILTEILTIVVCILWAKAKKGWAWGLVPLIAGLLLKVMIDQIGFVNAQQCLNIQR